MSWSLETVTASQHCTHGFPIANQMIGLEMQTYKNHSFHIPVLGIGFSIDAPLKVARYGISSVLSLVDDSLMEELRKYYLQRDGHPYEEINEKEPDARARRITAYLNMVHRMVREQFAALRESAFGPDSDIHKYFDMLPDFSELKRKYREMNLTTEGGVVQRLQRWLRDHMTPGAIEVNIMTKVDKPNHDSTGQELPVEFNDAHASLRGFAMSDVESSIVFSAGMNPRLYGYMSTLPAFYPGPDGSFRKRITIKVSDFRSALIQGKFLAKKGLWVSEFRIESGLNCGGHAFATDGLLMGPILEEFKIRRKELHDELLAMYIDALRRRDIYVDPESLHIDITAQGGVGLNSEHEFLLRRYELKSVGWGTPFLLVPEVMNVPENTLEKLRAAKAEDLYLSDVSPLGVPFNNLRDNEKDTEKHQLAEAGKPGSPCIKKFLAFNTEYSKKPLCTASITYLKHKVRDLHAKHQDDVDSFNDAKHVAIDKACLCEGLTISALNVKHIDLPKLSKAVSVCPGPNLAYFSRVSTLKEMVDHIYGRINIMNDSTRPHMFVKELQLYIDYLQRLISNSISTVPKKTEEYLQNFATNLLNGIQYYRELLPDLQEESMNMRQSIRKELEALEERLMELVAVPA